MNPKEITIDFIAQQVGLSNPRLLLLSKRAPFLYKEYEKEKRGGGVRIINSPHKELKAVQRKILDKILYHIPTQYFMGGGKGSSTIEVMSHHVGKKVVMHFDISGFFPNLKRETIMRSLIDRGFSRDVATLITKLTTFKGHLPQGAPCSTQLAKFAVSGPAKNLIKLYQNYEGQVDISFWVDDVIISGPMPIRNTEKTVYAIFNRFGFVINRKKTKIMFHDTEQSALGLRVDRKVIEPDNEFLFKYKTELSKDKNSQTAIGLKNYSRFVRRKSAHILKVNKKI